MVEHALLDDLIHSLEQRLRNRQPEGLRSLDDQFGLHRLLHWPLRRPFALVEPTRIVALEAVRIGKAVSVADQAAGGGQFGGMRPLGHGVTRRQRSQLLAASVEEGIDLASR